MPLFTVPIHESNDCHTPAGSDKGGEFCASIPGLKVSTSGERLDAEVGFISLNRPRTGTGPMRIEEIYVYERFRGKGWGQKLYQAAAAHAKTLGYAGVWSSVNSRTAQASHAWDRLRKTGRVRRTERSIIGEKTRKLQVDVLERNDCHTPAGSGKGGEFCSGEAAFALSGVLFHGSPQALTSLQPGSMLTVDPHWAAGYATRSRWDAQRGDVEEFVGRVHVTPIPTGKVVYARTLHGAERLLIDMARQQGHDGSGRLSDAAKYVQRKTGLDAIIAKDGSGPITGAIVLNPAAVTLTVDPAQAVRAALRRGKMVASNLERIVTRSNARTERG